MQTYYCVPDGTPPLASESVFYQHSIPNGMWRRRWRFYQAVIPAGIWLRRRTCFNRATTMVKKLNYFRHNNKFLIVNFWISCQTLRIKAYRCGRYVRKNVHFFDCFLHLQNELNGSVYKPLRQLDYFKSFRVPYNTVEWANGADYAPEYLYSIGV